MTYRDASSRLLGSSAESEMNSKLLSRLAFFFAVFGSAMLILIIAFAKGMLSGRNLAIITLALCSIAVWILTTIIKSCEGGKIDRSVLSVISAAITRGSPNQIIWLLCALIGVCSIGLIVGLSTMDGKPIGPEIVGMLTGGPGLDSETWDIHNAVKQGLPRGQVPLRSGF